jgi:hypothetical protein
MVMTEQTKSALREKLVESPLFCLGGNGKPCSKCERSIDETIDALLPEIEKLENLARVDELRQLIRHHSEQHKAKQEIFAVHDNVIKGSTLAMVPVPHINDRIAQLTQEEKS